MDQDRTDHVNQNYSAYLLRLWRVKDNEHSSWRMSLEDSHTGARLGFANLRQLYFFLLRRIGEVEHLDDEEHKDRSESK